MRVVLFLALGLLNVLSFANSKPMESLEKYNVVLVHGASNSDRGIEALCNSGEVKNAYEHQISAPDSAWNLGEAVRMMGGFKTQDTLTYWLDTEILEKYRYFNSGDTTGTSPIYIQRSFVNPANSPIANALELGDPTWQGENYCVERRSLIEEAQEVKVGGQEELKRLRTSKNYFNIPSRNILIGYSMGGVAASEYVRGDFYNDDVDKVITLDSPLEGTGALNMQLHINEEAALSTNKDVANMFVGIATAYTIASLASNNDAIVSSAIMVAALGIYANNFINKLTAIGIKIVTGFGYKASDPLTKYIDPKKQGVGTVNNLKKRDYRNDQPMYRILDGKNGLTFSDPKENGFLTFINYAMPSGLTAGLGNFFAHALSDAPAEDAFINSITGLTFGATAGITLQDAGTALVPSSSGMGENTTALNDSRASVFRKQYDANYLFQEDLAEASNILSFAHALKNFVGIILATNLIPDPVVQKATALTLAVSYASTISLSPFVARGTKNLELSHLAPTIAKYQKSWKGRPNSYRTISGSESTITPYLMEDFLYEKPFVNLRVSSANDFTEVPDSTNQDSLGLYYNCDSNVCQSLAVIAPDTTKKYPLTFKNAYDWEKMGVKIDTWTRVSGVDGTVPIRHVNRYAMPDVVVEDNINRYSFVVDDLMPHRLRQIRINFNFVEDLAWECDIINPTAIYG